MADRIRLGFIGANVRATWAAQSHFPALLASPDVELTAVCTTRRETAEAAREAFGAKLAFTDFREMVVSNEIDAVAVVVRVPAHYEPTRAAIEAGKHVYTEWPLGRTTAEAEELAALARARDVQTACGLQSRVSPALLYMKEQIEAGFVGEVLSCHADCMRDGALERPSSRTWQRDASLGANPLTIANGHVIDALRFVVGNFTRVSAMLTTQARQWYETDTEPVADLRHRGRPASLPRYDPAVIGYGTGAASGLRIPTGGDTCERTAYAGPCARDAPRSAPGSRSLHREACRGSSNGPGSITA